jgi:hypothetical protein
VHFLRRTKIVGEPTSTIIQQFAFGSIKHFNEGSTTSVTLFHVLLGVESISMGEGFVEGAVETGAEAKAASFSVRIEE